MTMTRPLPRRAPAPQRPQLTAREQEVAGVVGRRAAIVAFALFFSAHLPQLDYTAAFTPPNLEAGLTAVCAAVAFYGAVYVAVYMLAVYGVEVRGFLKPRAAQPAEPQQQLETTHPAVRAVVVDRGENYVTDFERTMHEDGRFLVGNELVNPAQYGVEPWWMAMIARVRVEGGLETVSLTQLHDIGIDRKERAGEQDSDAHRVIELLDDAGLVEFQGERRPYLWTALGRQVFGGAA